MHQRQGTSEQSNQEISELKPGPFEEFDWKEYFARYKQDGVSSKVQENDSFLDLTELVSNIDGKIAQAFLTQGKDIKKEMKLSGHCRVDGLSPDKWLRAEKSHRRYSSHCSSYKKCTAACAFWIIKNFLKEEPNGEEHIEKPLLTVSCSIINSLAKGHRLENGTDLYYIYNSGLEYMIGEFPLQTIVLTAWRYHHRNSIYYNRKITKPIDDLVVGFVKDYHYSQAKAANVSIDDYFEILIGKMDGYVKYLANIRPASKPYKIQEIHALFRKHFLSHFEDAHYRLQ